MAGNFQRGLPKVSKATINRIIRSAEGVAAHSKVCMTLARSDRSIHTKPLLFNNIMNIRQTTIGCISPCPA